MEAFIPVKSALSYAVTLLEGLKSITMRGKGGREGGGTLLRSRKAQVCVDPHSRVGRLLLLNQVSRLCLLEVRIQVARRTIAETAGKVSAKLSAAKSGV